MASKKPEYASMAANRRHFNHTTDVRTDRNSSSELNQEYNATWRKSLKTFNPAVPLEKLHVINNQPFKLNPAKISALKPSIQDTGIIQPIIVRTSNINDKNENYDIISGRHRYLAAKELYNDTGDEKYSTVPCLVVECPDENLDKMICFANQQRATLSLSEQYDLITSLKQNNKKDGTKYTAEEIGEMFGLSRITVFRILRLREINSYLKKYFDNEVLSILSLDKINSALNHEQQYVFYEYLTSLSPQPKNFVNSKVEMVLTCFNENPGASAAELGEYINEQSAKKAAKPRYKTKVYNQVSSEIPDNVTEAELDILVTRLLKEHFSKA